MDPLGYAFHTPSWTLSVRNFFSQFFDLFGEFGGYSAPTYRHDRCERSVQMRLYTLNKRHFFLVFAAFFLCFGISVLVGLTGPPITETTEKNASSLEPVPSNFKTGSFVLKSPPVSTFHQQLWLVAEIITDNEQDATTFQQKFQVGIQVRGLLEENRSDLVYNGQIYNRSRTLRCNRRCDDLILLHLGYLDYPNYIITVHFYGLESIKFNIKDIRFSFKSYNPTFTQLEIWFRFVFLVFTFIATIIMYMDYRYVLSILVIGIVPACSIKEDDPGCLFAHSLRKFSVRDWSIEQKWMSVLLPMLLLYNNPIFPLTFLINSWIPGMFDAMFQASFLGGLLLFWLCLYHGVRQPHKSVYTIGHTDLSYIKNKRLFTTFYAPKLVIVGLIWISAVTLSSWQEYNELQDPTYNYRLDTGNFLAFKIFFFSVGAIYLLYLIYLLVRAYGELRSMPYFDIRLKFMTFLMVVVLSISVTIMVLRFGGTALRDNFVAELSTHYQNSAEFLSFYGLLNFYLYTMAFVYSPSRNAVFESHFKDNPALSMLNDSDDEVVYGSDHEEMALTRKAVQTFDSDEEAFN